MKLIGHDEVIDAAIGLSDFTMPRWSGEPLEPAGYLACLGMAYNLDSRRKWPLADFSSIYRAREVVRSNAQFPPNGYHESHWL